MRQLAPARITDSVGSPRCVAPSPFDVHFAGTAKAGRSVPTVSLEPSRSGPCSAATEPLPGGGRSSRNQGFRTAGATPVRQTGGAGRSRSVTGPAACAAAKALQLLHGYLRGRSYFWSNFSLGSYNDPTLRQPFTVPLLGCPDSAGNRPALTGAAGATTTTAASPDVRTAGMRFRPTGELVQASGSRRRSTSSTTSSSAARPRAGT